jgi:polyphosphate kinase 2 (PPK2 family)
VTSHLHRLPPGPVDLTSLATDETPGFDGGKKKGTAALAALGDELSDLQERLWAERTAGSQRRVLLVLQGMDTSGKGALPPAGYIGVFDRSHYEDVLIVRVHGWAEPETIERRYDEINEFEAGLVADGHVVIKCMLHISPEVQKERLLARLDSPDKYWKFNPGDVDERSRWGDYRTAYGIALERTNTAAAPWYVVPSDKKWYRNLVIGQLLLDHLRAMDLRWPPADFDVDEQRRRLADEAPVS